MSGPVRLIDIREGAEFEIDLTAFSEPEPVFAYVDDAGSRVAPRSGLVLDGRVIVEGQPPFMWLKGPRDCVRLRATTEGGPRSERVSFRALSVGEFCVEIYHVRRDGRATLLHQNDFCFK
ncbi:MAG: hypothetical protein R3A48_07815 [Polyangiales bacterium]